MAEFGAPVVGEASKSSLSHLEREFRYLFYFRTNVRNLNLEVEFLTAKRDEVFRRIEEATMNDEVIRETVKVWLKAVDEFLGKATKLNDKAASIDRWFKGWVLGSRFSTGRGSQKLIESVKSLLQHADAFGEKVADKRLVHELVSFDGVLTPDGDFKDFGSRVTTANQVIQVLQDDKVSLLGIYGMAGIGKSTLISALTTYVKKHKLFDEAVLVTLSQTSGIEEIQSNVAKGLELKFEDDTLETKALRLLARLSQPQKTLIVLDNVWQSVELSEIGIPLGLNNCKVVFTTRSQDVCNSMGAGEARIKIEVLSPEESWDLFRKKAGDEVDSPAFQGVARDVLNECQGLPLLIVTLGKALYRKDKTYWDAALESLQNSTILPNPIFTGMSQVYYGIKSSYDFLESEEVKFCFLLCCLFPDGYHISMDQLFHYMMGERRLAKESKLQTARFQLHIIVDKLLSSCLLLRANSGCIMMHDVVRDVALAISSEDSGFVVEAGRVLNDWPDRQLADCRRLSLITIRGNRMNWSLPSQIQAANLLTLSLHANEGLISIPPQFFEETPSLLTLDLSYTGIKVLPPSIMFLANLRALLLEGCFDLKGVYLSNKLENLEILSLRYSAIESFTVSPEVKTLKQLDLSYTSKLERISQNIISSFVKLEELYLLDSFRAWEPERTELGESPSKGKDRAEKDEPEGAGTSSSAEADRLEDYARLSEVVLLRHLTSLEFHVGNLDWLCRNIPNWESLTRFKIAVGVIDDFSPFGISDGMLLEKSMYIELRSKVVANWVKVLLGRTNFLQLKGSQSLSDLAQLDPIPEQQIFLELQVLVLSEMESGTSLIRCDMLVRLRNLKKLVVANCMYMQKLIDFEVEDKAVLQEATSNTVKFSILPLFSVFPNLTYLRVCACTELRYLFPMRIIRCLSQLQVLEVLDCRNLEAMIEFEGENKAGETSVSASSSSSVKSKDLSKLSASLVFSNLTSLIVHECHKLRYLLPVAVVRNMAQLKELDVSHCSSMETIIEYENVAPVNDKGLLPKLEKLTLRQLPKLSSFAGRDILFDWPSLTQIWVDNCLGLKKLPLGRGSVPKLETFWLHPKKWSDELIWEDEQLKSRLHSLPKWKSGWWEF